MAESDSAPPLVRLATSGDVATIVAFNEAMARETEDKGLSTERLRAGVAAVLSDPGRGVYRVALVDGREAGCLLITREWSDWRNAWFWWIQSVYVAPWARRRGVYVALHEEVRRAARAAGDVCGLRLYVDSENAGAMRTYERVGMHHARYEMYEEALDPGAGA